MTSSLIPPFIFHTQAYKTVSHTYLFISFRSFSPLPSYILPPTFSPFIRASLPPFPFLSPYLSHSFLPFLAYPSFYLSFSPSFPFPLPFLTHSLLSSSLLPHISSSLHPFYSLLSPLPSPSNRHKNSLPTPGSLLCVTLCVSAKVISLVIASRKSGSRSGAADHSDQPPRRPEFVSCVTRVYEPSAPSCGRRPPPVLPLP